MVDLDVKAKNVSDKLYIDSNWINGDLAGSF